MRSKLQKEHLDYIMFMLNHYEALEAFSLEMDRFIKKYIDKHPDWKKSIKPDKIRKFWTSKESSLIAITCYSGITSKSLFMKVVEYLPLYGLIRNSESIITINGLTVQVKDLFTNYPDFDWSIWIQQSHF